MDDRESLVSCARSEQEDIKVIVPRPPIIDTGDDEVEILLRYDNAFRALIHAGWKLNANNEKGSLIGWCICFGFKGKLYFDGLRSQLNFSMLRCALFIVAAMAAYIDPPDLGNSLVNDFFMVTVGFSAVANLCSIIAYTLFSIMINRPYTLIDSLVARVRNHAVYVIGTVFDCVGVLSLLGALLLARTHAAGTVAQPLAVMLFLGILTAWLWAVIYTDEVQTKRIKLFSSSYLSPTTGELRKSVLAAIYRPADMASLLAAVDQAHHLDKFVGIDLDAALLMDKADLADVFHVSTQLTRTGADRASPEERSARLLLLTEIRVIYEEIVHVKKLGTRT